MTTLLAPTRPPAAKPGRTRIIERTTTVTREIFLDHPAPAQAAHGRQTQTGFQTQSGAETLGELQQTSSVADERIHGIDRTLVRLGVWLIGLGRAHALRPSASADEIAAKVDAAKAHDLKHFIGLPH